MPFSSDGAHDLRHLYAVERHRATGDVYAVQRALDHASPNATATYLAGLGMDINGKREN